MAHIEKSDEKILPSTYKLHLIQKTQCIYTSIEAMPYAMLCSLAASAFYRTIDLWFVVSVCDFVNDLWFPVYICSLVDVCFFFCSFSLLTSFQCRATKTQRPRLVKIDHHTKYKDTVLQMAYRQQYAYCLVLLLRFSFFSLALSARLCLFFPFFQIGATGESRTQKNSRLKNSGDQHRKWKMRLGLIPDCRLHAYALRLYLCAPAMCIYM